MHYPVFLDLRSRPVLVVGGGKVAFAKIQGLLEAGAQVTVVAPRIDKTLPGAELLPREFEPRDLDGKWYAVAAATPEVNAQVARAAQERRIFVNAVDDAASATAFLGGVVRRGGVTLAVSTDGRAPALAGLLREALERVLPEELSEWTRVGQEVRARWKRAGVPIGERRPLLLEALNDIYRRPA
jgi:uroporphyrin-III C-methyltransferase/precorrin-2 dehydrogenase/sirohydrochlorin ferrochelatase